MSTKPTIKSVEPLLKKYMSKPQNGVGGSLHLFTDGNVKDRDIQFCLGTARLINDYDGALLARLLLEMSKTQRLKLARCAYTK